MSENLYPSQLKLVIWDLDGTFWDGTLSETRVSVKPGNINRIQSLSKRGIINSICSKNDFEQAKKVLEDLGVWHLFVFPQIDWSPKGKGVEQIISSMGLRAENCILIDDLESNLGEAAATLPGLWVYHPDDILDKLDDTELFPGRCDPSLQRLAHYKTLASRSAAVSRSKNSNIEFLKESEIEVMFDFEPEKNLERVFELIERTNQLNYTKKRLPTEAARSDLLERLDFFQTQAGLVHCRDRFGDYGPVGFFFMRTTAHGRKLEHFLFSCRTLNMGLESYVYEFLRRPRIDVANPVAYNLDTYGGAPWIRRRDSFSTATPPEDSFDASKVLLLGPCHLLQVSSFLGTGTLDFLHQYRGKSLIKFDCPGFFLSPKAEVEGSRFLDKGITWSKDDYVRFHEVLPSAKTVVLDLGDFTRIKSLAQIDGLELRPFGEEFEDLACVRFVPIDLTRRLELVREVIEFVSQKTRDDAEILVMNRAFNQKTANGKLATEMAFDRFLRTVGDTKVRVIDCNSLVNHEEFDGGGHLPRSAYFILSEIVKGRMDIPD